MVALKVAEVPGWYMERLGETFWDYGVPTFAVLIGSWTMFCAVVDLVIRTGWYEHLKLQPHSKTSGKMFWNGCRDSAFNWAWLALITPFSGPVFQALFPKEIETPPVFELFKMSLFSVCIFDFWFYCFHRTLHEYPTLYKKYHKPHHLYTATFVWMSHAQHPVEIMLNSIGTLAGPLIWSYCIASEPCVNVYMIWFWFAQIQLFGVVDHCGYDFGISPFFFFHFPFLLDTYDHDEHHRLLKVSYGGMFKIWDWFGGTVAIRPKKSV